MRLLSFQADGKSAFGALIEGRIVDLSRHMPELGNIRDLLKQQMLVRALDIAAEASADYNLTDVDLLPPILEPNLLVAVPMTDPVELCFSIQVDQFSGPDQPLAVEPAEDPCTAVGAIAAIIGKPTENVPQAEALSHVAGLSLMNLTGNPELTNDVITDYQNLHAGFGPWLVTLDELSATEPLPLSMGINDVVSEYSVRGIEAAISRASEVEPMMPGDVVVLLPVTAHLPSALQPGDQLTLEAAGLGRLENSIPRQSEPAQ